MRGLRGSLVCAAAAALVMAGCEKDSTSKKKLEGEVTVGFGDCAGPTARFESGPRPQPFDIDEVEVDMTRRASVAKNDDGDGARLTKVQGKPVEEEELEEEEPDEEEEGGTGTAMALEEGKMGREDSDRETGQYAMEKVGDEPQLARQQAIDQARETGILGTMEAQQGGAFASLTGTGDASSGLDDSDVYGGLLGDEVGEMQGGYGFGPGGGGPGWGTIGTGKYGTIGHGSGTGSGYGAIGGRGRIGGRKGTPPQVRIGNATATGDLDKNIIRRYIRRTLPKLKYCYEKELLVKPALAGTVVTQFVISPEGDVMTANAKGVDGNVASCVAGVIESIEFPKPRGGGIVQVRYPFTFRPGTGGDDADAPTPKPDTEPEPDPTPTPTPKPVPADTAGAAPEEYEAGTANPLRDHADELEACFRKQTARRFAAMVVEMSVGDDGKISKARTHGAGDDDVAKCIAGVAEKMTWKTDVRTYRCPVTFGPMPIAEAPGIDITAKEVVHVSGGRHVVASTKGIVDDTSPAWKIPELYERLREERLTHIVALPEEIVSITGPPILRPASATPMKVVNRVVKTALAAEAHYLFAVEKDGAWTILPRRGVPEPSALPMPPVPYGIGAPWRAGVLAIGRDAMMRLPDEIPVRVSVLVTADELWIGLSRVGDRRKIEKEGGKHDWKALAEILTEYRETRYLQGRHDIEIAGEDDVPWSDVAEAIEHLAKGGFDAWGITDPAALSVRFKI